MKAALVNQPETDIQRNAVLQWTAIQQMSKWKCQTGYLNRIIECPIPTTNTSHLQGLKDLETFELPICLCKTLRVSRHKPLASRRTMIQVSIILHQGAQLTAQVDIDDDRLVSKMARNITVGVGEICKGHWPLGRIRVAAGIGDV